MNYVMEMSSGCSCDVRRGSCRQVQYVWLQERGSRCNLRHLPLCCAEQELQAAPVGGAATLAPGVPWSALNGDR